MKKTALILTAMFSLATLFAFTLPGNWTIGEKYNISFSNSSTSGIFKTFTGKIVFDEKNLAHSRFDVTIDVASINTGNGMMNKHAKSSDWFDAARYPSIRFVSQKIVRSATGYQVTGNLQMHGITKAMTLPFLFKQSGGAGNFTGSFVVNRTDFGIGNPGGEVDEEIRINVTVPVFKK